MILGMAAWLLLATVTHAADVTFVRHVLNTDCDFSAAAAMDVNHDGKKDIVCGSFWYEAPAWKRHFVCDVPRIRGRPDGFAHLPLDVNRDGWTDIVTVNYRSRSIKWVEHPGAGLGPWTTHTVEEPGPMETGRLVDVDGDGQLDILPNGVQFAAWWELAWEPGASGTAPRWVRHELPREVAGHGVGFGDVDGDGRGDIVAPLGWLKAPERPRRDRWLWSPEFDLGRASIPILVVDVDEDGDNDIVWARAHGFGLYWLEQSHSDDAKKRRWIHHTIDTSWSQAHSPLWADLDGEGQNELVAGKRFMAHEGLDPGEYDTLVAYRYQFDRGTRTWHRWLISWDEGVGFGLDPKADDLDGDGDRDLILSGRSGLYWLENLGATGAPRAQPEPPTYEDHGRLLVVKDHLGAEKAVTTPLEWGRRRSHIIASIESALGPLPGPHRRVPLDVEVSQEFPSDFYRRQRITFRANSERRIAADLLVPTNAGGGKFPAVLCLHRDLDHGNAAPTDSDSSSSLQIADELARRGYVCIVPQSPALGASPASQPKIADPKAGDIMQLVWNNMRAIDLLESMPEVNAERIVCVGHGLGGELALLSAALDQRVVATVTSAVFASLGGGPKRHFGSSAQDRAARPVGSREASDLRPLPFDLPEVLAAIAPRALFVHAPSQDKHVDVESVKQAVASALAVFELRGAARMLKAVYPESGRSFPENVRHDAYQWLQDHVPR